LQTKIHNKQITNANKNNKMISIYAENQYVCIVKSKRIKSTKKGYFLPYKQRVTGSTPVAPTNENQRVT